MPLYPVVTQVQLVGRASNNDEPVVGQGRNTEFKSWLRTATRRLHTDPLQPVARLIRPERKDVRPVQGRVRVAAPRLSPLRRTESSSLHLAWLPGIDCLVRGGCLLVLII